ncbi:MAG: hypothetical protein KAG66_17375, partial [Methylococcales bacterium]|nr:hypothetical protein [Methylococcales bacterium]
MKRRIPLFTLLLLAFAVISCQTESRETSVDLIGPDPINAVFDTPEYAMHTALWWDISDEAIPDIPMVANMGFGWVKQNIAWRDVENIKKGEYDVYRPDRIVEEAEKEGLNLLIRIDRQPLWAQVSQDELIENGPPADYNDFGDFCGWLATRYTGRIAAYQVSNEPNLHR